jgi:hypothetical protein
MSETNNVFFTEEQDDVPLPPPNLSSSFKTIDEWLSNICDNDGPEKAISRYTFGVFESPDEYVLFLVGWNTYVEGNHAVTQIDFEPSDMYFPLPLDQYKNMNRAQVFDELERQLREFLKSEKFKNSFLAEGKTIELAATGEVLFQQ